jgi:hypothetical protein
MAPKHRSRRRYRCRFCGAMLAAWLPVAKQVDGARLLYHLGQHHLKDAGPYLQRMEVESIDRVLAELFAVVEGDEAP